MTQNKTTSAKPFCVDRPEEDARHLIRHTGMPVYRETRRCAQLEDILGRWPLLAAVTLAAPTRQDRPRGGQT